MRKFSNFAVWNPTYLILKFYSLFGTLDPEEMKSSRDYKWFTRDFKISPEEYIPFLKVDGEVPSMDTVCDMIEPFLHVNSKTDDDERLNTDVVAGYALTESASNMILDYIDKFKELCLSKSDFRYCCSTLWSRLDVFFDEYDGSVYDEDLVRFKRYIDESFLDGDSAEDIVTSVYESELYNNFLWVPDEKFGHVIRW